MMEAVYPKALALLQQAASPQGFLASVQPVTNYHRVWARDGVICGLAALVSGDPHLIATLRNTLTTLAQHQHALGTIPSNVRFLRVITHFFMKINKPLKKPCRRWSIGNSITGI
jgi:GH15 family glucan-1,4-alpha-glucosidase